MEPVVEQTVEQTVEQVAEQNMITLTPAAAEKLSAVMNEKGLAETHALRVFVRGGGCGGMQYGMTFDTAREGDNVIDMDGVTFYMDRKSTIYLKGIVLDYKEGLKGKGFVFQNPNATSTCGCGESFSV